ncbi:hypothetical protein, partial [Streptococcus pseudopneumoniae]|uniref:hypothetical protein n=1 Tax=Streptococcus pseudopneumoniae TaxID=257758 RepID=UPI0019D5087A
GAGSCRKLERQLTTTLSFRDFSKDKSGQGLPADVVKTVNDHFAPMLQSCLEAQARRLTPPDSMTYDVQWTVSNEGRVTEVHL